MGKYIVFALSDCLTQSFLAILVAFYVFTFFLSVALYGAFKLHVVHLASIFF